MRPLGTLHVRAVELVRAKLPLARPVRTAHGEVSVREALLVRVQGAGGEEGWGECSAEDAPGYWHEWTDGCEQVLRRFLLPRLIGATVGLHDLPRVPGWPMATAAVECAVLDALLRRADLSLADWLGATRRRVDATLTLGIGEEPDPGPYRFLKLKVAPGHVPVVPAEVPTVLDANGSFSPAEVRHLVIASAWYFEQPLPPDDLVGHARLAQRVQVALDESIRSVGDVHTAAALKACRIVVLKPGRLGGVLAAKAAHDAAVAARLQVKVGGMWDTGIGRAVALALAGLPGCTLPADLSASDRYFAEDVVEDPATLDADGRLAVPRGPGIGVTVKI